MGKGTGEGMRKNMDLEIFLKQNKVKKENIKYAESESFKNNGKAVLWEIKAISADEDIRIRESCMKNSFDENLKKYKKVFDPREYALKLCAASTVYPDLKNAALQESYGVMGEERLLGKMLTGGEYERYLEKVQQINGYGKAMNELKEEAKN